MTPLGLYKKMIEDYKKHGTSYAHIRTTNLDEYQGLPASHEQSYAYFMRENLFRHPDIELSNIYIENGMAKNEEEECARYNPKRLENTVHRFCSDILPNR